MPTEFQSAIDVCNRALQHVGSERIDPTLGFNEISTRAAECGFAYGKLRTAELRRNVWRFATRRAILRAIDGNTMLLLPTLFNNTAVYFVGSVVADGTGNLWISNTRDNVGNDPQNTTLWEPYFGPVTVSLYDGTQAYFAGELVYTAGGDGTYNVYLSKQNSNAVHPGLPNLWSSATVYSQDDVVIVWPAWSSGTTYSQGQTVQYTDGNVYTSLTNTNLNQIPSASPTNWALVPVLSLSSQPVPITTVVLPPTMTPVSEWSQGTTYALGGIVMFKGRQWVSIQANNLGQFPAAVGSTWWVALTGGTGYISLFDTNLGNNPASAPALWAVGTIYATGNQVGGSDGQIYTSLSNGNVGHDPTLDGGVHWQPTGVLNPWSTAFVQGIGNPLWTQIGGAAFPSGVGLKSISIIYPLNAGPATQDGTRNAFRLPSGYLKVTSQDPKAGSVSFLGAPSGLQYKDWLFEGNYIVSREVDPIMFRFVADVTDVTLMDPMFCEGLACRIAIEVWEKLTQKTGTIGVIEQQYKTFMGDARTVNAIEIGSEEPPEDDYVSCRL